MIGKDFLNVRSRVGTSLFALKDLANDVGLEGENPRILDNLLSSLNDPFVMVLVGEVNVGKSSFLNTLFRGEYSPTGVLPTTEKIYFFKHGEVYQESWVSDTMREVRIPSELLRDFHLVDTPGTNSLHLEHQEITERIVPVADLIFFVFSVVNPWGASAWEFLDKIQNCWMRNVVFVLQQCDLRQVEEVQLIKNKIQELSFQRFGHRIPVFEVSAKLAQQERNFSENPLDAQAVKPSIFGEAAFERVGNFISEQLASNRGRLLKLKQAVHIGQKVLGQVSSAAKDRTQDAAFTDHVHEEITSLIARAQERSIEKITTPIRGATSDYQWLSQDLLQFLMERLKFSGFIKSAWWENRRWDNLDERYTEETAKVVAPRLTQIAQILSDDLKLLRRDLQERCRELGTDAQAFDYFEKFSIEKTHVSAKDFQIHHPPVGDKLNQVIQSARGSVRWGMTLLLLSLVSAGVLLYLRLPYFYLVGSALSIIAAIQCFVSARKVLREGFMPVKELLASHSHGVTQYFDVYVKDRVKQFYHTFHQEENRMREAIRFRDHEAYQWMERAQALSQNFEVMSQSLKGLMEQSQPEPTKSLQGLDLKPSKSGIESL